MFSQKGKTGPKVDEKHDTSIFFLFQNTKSQNKIKKHSYIETKRKLFIKKTHNNYTVNWPSKKDFVNFLIKNYVITNNIKIKMNGEGGKMF
jgi:hypothetical protein